MQEEKIAMSSLGICIFFLFLFSRRPASGNGKKCFISQFCIAAPGLPWHSLVSVKPQLQGPAVRLGQRDGWTDERTVALLLLWRETSMSGPGNLALFDVQII